MTATNPQELGDALENAVHAIETLILRTNPAIKDAPITIEPKKIVVVDGVKHEIDLYITIDLGHGYKSVYIFECKNWQETVGKNEIIVFSEKINAVQAQKGYFIATKFGEYAQAQAKKDKRIELLTASDALASLPPYVYDYHIMDTTVTYSHLEYRLATDDPQDIEKLTLTKESFVKYNNESLLERNFTERIQSSLVEEAMDQHPIALFGEGVYHYKYDKTFVFQPDELFVECITCLAVVAHVTWDAYIIRSTIVSAFDIQTRGRTITFESVKLHSGGDFTTSFVAIE